MLYISRVRGNAKVGCDDTLGERTLIVGPNGSGKSTRVACIELALSSRASDIAGKASIATPVDLLALAPGREGQLWSELTWSNDSIGTFKMEGSIGKGHRPDVALPAHAKGDGVLPIRLLTEAFSSTDKARKFLLERAVPLTEADVLAVLPTARQELYMKAAKARAMPTVAETLVRVTEYAGEQKRKGRAEEKAAGVIAQGAANEAIPVTDQEYTHAVSSRDRLQKRINDIRARQASLETWNAAAGQIEALEEKVRELSARAEEAAAYTRGQTLLDLLDKAGERQLKRCQCCGQDVDPAVWAERHRKITAAVEKVKVNGYDPDALPAARTRLISLSMLEEPKPLDASENLKIVEASLASAEALVKALDQRKAAYASARRVLDQGFLSAEDAKLWGELEDLCKKATHKLVATATAKFSAAVQKHLPKGEVFQLRMGEGDRDVVQFGLVRDGVLHTALSGAEWARVTCALAAVVCASEPFAVIIPDERAFDPETLARVMRALSKAPCQVILTSPVPQKGRTPKGWTVITLTGQEAAPDSPDDDEIPEPELSEAQGIMEQVAATMRSGEAVEDEGEIDFL